MICAPAVIEVVARWLLFACNPFDGVAALGVGLVVVVGRFCWVGCSCRPILLMALV